MVSRRRASMTVTTSAQVTVKTGVLKSCEAATFRSITTNLALSNYGDLLICCATENKHCNS
jgi:hypothetical protein